MGVLTDDSVYWQVDIWNERSRLPLNSLFEEPSGRRNQNRSNLLPEGVQNLGLLRNIYRNTLSKLVREGDICIFGDHLVGILFQTATAWSLQKDILALDCGGWQAGRECRHLLLLGRGGSWGLNWLVEIGDGGVDLLDCAETCFFDLNPGLWLPLDVGENSLPPDIEIGGDELKLPECHIVREGFLLLQEAVEEGAIGIPRALAHGLRVAERRQRKMKSKCGMAAFDTNADQEGNPNGAQEQAGVDWPRGEVVRPANTTRC